MGLTKGYMALCLLRISVKRMRVYIRKGVVLFVVARILESDLRVALERLSSLRASIPKWEPCLPGFWSQLDLVCLFQHARFE